MLSPRLVRVSEKGVAFLNYRTGTVGMAKWRSQKRKNDLRELTWTVSRERAGMFSKGHVVTASVFLHSTNTTFLRVSLLAQGDILYSKNKQFLLRASASSLLLVIFVFDFSIERIRKQRVRIETKNRL